ncbi:MAG: hypothetical protein AB9866_26055 [Syntrophobacteraceae bacterium]
MVLALLLFFGITFIYTGLLVFERDVTWACVIAFAGLILLVKPALYAFYLIMSHLDQRPRPGKPKGKPGSKGRRDHLRVVHSKDDKPTIH